MDFLKQNYLKLSIKRQIQLGILSFSSCLCCLVIMILSINCFILMKISFDDILNLIDQTENAKLDSLNMYIGISNINSDEIIEDNIQFMSNLKSNFERNQDFLLSYKSVKVDKRIRLSDNYLDCDYNDNISKYNCIITNQLSDNDKLFFFIFPLFQQSFKLRLLSNRKSDIVRNISFYDYKNNQMYFFPNSASYNPELYSSNIREISKLLIINMSASYDIGNSSIADFYSRNPVKFNLSPFSDASDSKINDFSFYSFRLLYNTSLSNILDPLYYKETFSLTFSDNIIENLGNYVTKILTDIKVILAYSSDDSIINLGKCNEMLYLQQKNYSLINFSEKFDNNNKKYFRDCFSQNMSTFKTLLNFMSFSKESSLKIDLPVINYNTYFNVVYNSHKIFRFSHPDIYYKSISKPRNSIQYNYTAYIVKDNRYLQNNKEIIGFKMTSVFLTILVLMLLVWFVVFSFIFYTLTFVVKSLTVPLKNLIQLVNNLGHSKIQEDNLLTQSIDEMEIDKIYFNDDKDISEFINVCKDIVKGGFKEENDQKQKNKFHSHTSQNISFIKPNNIMVNEQKFSSNFKKLNNLIFNYKPSKFLNDNIYEQDKYEKQENNRDVNFYDSYLRNRKSLYQNLIFDYTREFKFSNKISLIFNLYKSINT